MEVDKAESSFMLNRGFQPAATMMSTQKQRSMNPSEPSEQTRATNPDLHAGTSDDHLGQPPRDTFATSPGSHHSMVDRERQSEHISRSSRRGSSDSLNSRHSSAARNHDQPTKAKSGPKLPCFDEAKDNIDAYLLRFERYAAANQWSRERWAGYLSALLKGKALDVYNCLEPNEATDYDALKNALLRKFRLTAEGFRKKFFLTRPDREETAAQFEKLVRALGFIVGNPEVLRSIEVVHYRRTIPCCL